MPYNNDIESDIIDSDNDMDNIDINNNENNFQDSEFEDNNDNDNNSDNESLHGPSYDPNNKRDYLRFLIYTSIFILAGAGNVFISKTTYQVIPSNNGNVSYWIPYCLMLSQFFTSIPIIFLKLFF